jgi:hypothetical protein
MRPIMWEVFTTDFSTTYDTLLSTLLHPNSGIVPHIRELYLSDRNDGDDEDDVRTRLLIAALPKDRLRVFQDYQTRTLTLQLLLQSQCKIEMLQTATCINGRHSPNDRHADMAMSFARRQH